MLLMSYCLVVLASSLIPESWWTSLANYESRFSWPRALGSKLVHLRVLLQFQRFSLARPGSSDCDELEVGVYCVEAWLV